MNELIAEVEQLSAKLRQLWGDNGDSATLDRVVKVLKEGTTEKPKTTAKKTQ